MLKKNRQFLEVESPISVLYPFVELRYLEDRYLFTLETSKTLRYKQSNLKAKFVSNNTRKKKELFIYQKSVENRKTGEATLLKTLQLMMLNGAEGRVHLKYLNVRNTYIGHQQDTYNSLCRTFRELRERIKRRKTEEEQTHKNDCTLLVLTPVFPAKIVEKIIWKSLFRI